MLDFAKRISNILNDESIYLGIKAGEELHANFYHDFLDEEGINLKRKSVDLAMRKLLDVLNEKIEENKIKNN